MPIAIHVPQLGESVVEATVGKWLVKEGEAVSKDQPIVELLTDKTDTEINAPAAGVIVGVKHDEDATVAVGDVLCEIDEAGSAAQPSGAAASDPSPPPSAASDLPAASPSTRQLAREMSVELSSIKGSGKGGTVTREDVQRAAKGVEAPAAPKPAAARPAAAAPAPSGRKSAFRMPPYIEREGDELVPFSRRRRIIADHMVFSKRTAPDVVTLAECDLERTARVRDQHKGRLKAEGVALTYLSFVAAATCRALREFPELNSRVLDDAYVKLRDVNLGVAVDTPQGLVVPVIRKADELTVKGLSRAISDLAARARDGELTPDDLANKTFTISNPGRKGNLVGGAIISQPNVGILRLGTIKKRVVVVERDGQDLMAIHPMMYMALTYDHRVVDGVHANGFLYRITELLENGEFDV